MNVMVQSLLFYQLIGQIYGFKNITATTSESYTLTTPTPWPQSTTSNPPSAYIVSDKPGLARTFDGIGGLSGGGATSKLLINYPDKQRNEILDLLFLPNYGASLNLLKVEIGGDDQSTDGGELSHQHFEGDNNYQRGYEWWLMKEAKKRNPSIKLYALPWTFPGWVGEGKQSPYTNREKTAKYVVDWLKGARDVHNLTIDYIGIWNERTADLDYVLILSEQLKAAGFGQMGIITNDGLMYDNTVEPYVTNQTLFDAIYGFGRRLQKAFEKDFSLHYPGTISPELAINSSKPIWSSEDYSTFNDNVGAGCWARILVQNYVTGYMTSTISWNLIAAYYPGLPYNRCGLMTSEQPWSGHYTIDNPIWISAHFTHFVEVGWKYLHHGSGVGRLAEGGTYVSLTKQDTKQLTIIAETMSHDHSICIRPFLPSYNVSAAQSATFQLDEQYKNQLFNVWRTTLKYDGTPDVVMEHSTQSVDSKGLLNINLVMDSMYTITTVDAKGANFPSSIPPSAEFPLPYKEHFQAQPTHADPFLITAQTGMWEILNENGSSTIHNQFARQIVTEQPLRWCSQHRNRPVAVVGNSKWQNVNISARVRIPSNSTAQAVFLGVRSNAVGCSSEQNTKGVYAWFYTNSSTVVVSDDFDQLSVLAAKNTGTILESDTWHSISLSIQNTTVSFSLNFESLGQIQTFEGTATEGFAAIGSYGFGWSDWDDLQII